MRLHAKRSPRRGTSEGTRSLLAAPAKIAVAIMKLVSPELTLHVIDGSATLERLMTDRGLDAVEKGNLRHATAVRLRTNRTGHPHRKDVRQQLDEMLNDVRWLQHGSSDVVYAAIGSYEWMKTNIPGLNCLTDDQLKKLIGRT